MANLSESTHTISIVATDSDRQVASNGILVTVDGTTPTISNVVLSTNGPVTISANADESCYFKLEIQYAGGGSNIGFTQPLTSGYTFNVPGFSEGTALRYRVIALDRVGLSSATEFANFAMPVSEPEIAISFAV